MVSTITHAEPKRFNPDFGQAMLRISLLGVVTLSFVMLWILGQPSYQPVVLLFVGLLVIAIGLATWSYLRPAPNGPRRILGMLFDTLLPTIALWYTGAAGVIMIAIYLLVIIGNGFRFGQGYLLLTQALCIAGFVTALVNVPYWQEHLVVGAGLVTALLVPPFYVMVLLRVLQVAHARTLRALEDCQAARSRDLNEAGTR